MKLTIDELSYWLALIKVPRLGPRGVFKLLKNVGEIKELFSRDRGFYETFGLSSEQIKHFMSPSWQSVEADLNWCDRGVDHNILSIICEDYPKQLLTIPDPPPIIYVAGSSTILNQLQVAIVGSRRSTPEGKEVAFEIAKNLAEQEITITSGLARGIDTAAHLGALNSGRTIAVIGTGIDVTYPLSNHELAGRIIQEGAIMSEFSLGTPPLPEHFPQRNRLISGLTLGTCVIEAAEKSGSLITAKCAVEQGREVFAVPGSIRNHHTKGCHQLIRQGAALVTCAQDILLELGINSKNQPNCSLTGKISEYFELEEPHLKLLECIGYEPAKIDLLVERSDFSVSQLAPLLLDLELSGHITSSYSGYRRVS